MKNVLTIVSLSLLPSLISGTPLTNLFNAYCRDGSSGTGAAADLFRSVQQVDCASDCCNVVQGTMREYATQSGRHVNQLFDELCECEDLTNDCFLSHCVFKQLRGLATHRHHHDDDDDDFAVFSFPPTPQPTPPTPNPTASPTRAPTQSPTPAPTRAPTVAPTAAPTRSPTLAPTAAPTSAPTNTPTVAPTAAPTRAPTPAPTAAPTVAPTAAPTRAPTTAPTAAPTVSPTQTPTVAPTVTPTSAPTVAPTMAPTPSPTLPVLSGRQADRQAGIRVQTHDGPSNSPDANTFLGRIPGIFGGRSDQVGFDYPNLSYDFVLSFDPSGPTLTFSTAGGDVDLTTDLSGNNAPDCLDFDSLEIAVADNDVNRGIGLQNVVVAGIPLGNFEQPNGTPDVPATRNRRYTIADIPFSSGGYDVTGTVVRAGSDFATAFSPSSGVRFDIFYSCTTVSTLSPTMSPTRSP